MTGPGIYQVYTKCRFWYIPGIYLSRSYEMPFYTGYIPGIYLSHEIVLSARLQNFYCNAAAHRYHLEPCQTRYRGFSRYRVTHRHDIMMIGSCNPISGFSFDPISGHVACHPISGTNIGYLPDIGLLCHRYCIPHN